MSDRKDHSQPVSEADRAARAAFREHCSINGGTAALADRHGLNQRTVERIQRGDRDVPPGVAISLATECREWRLVERAIVLERWAQECEQRRAAR